MCLCACEGGDECWKMSRADVLEQSRRAGAALDGVGGWIRAGQLDLASSASIYLLVWSVPSGSLRFTTLRDDIYTWHDSALMIAAFPWNVAKR